MLGMNTAPFLRGAYLACQNQRAVLLLSISSYPLLQALQCFMSANSASLIKALFCSVELLIFYAAVSYFEINLNNYKTLPTVTAYSFHSL
jgi:hypothetical protein